jgi:DNA-binding CsgD family transcriptional regulator
MLDQSKENKVELTERELEILCQVATGASNKEIASQLHISANTVKVHLRNVFAKIGVSSRTEAAMYAVNAGLVPMRAAAIELSHPEDQEGSGPPVEHSVSLRDKLASNRWVWAVLGILVVLGVLLGIRSYRQFTGKTGANTNLAEIPARWQSMAELPVGRYGLAAVSYQNSIYVVGGRTLAGDIGNSLRYDPISDAWSEIAAKPTAVYDIQAGMNEGDIYIPGGCQADGTASRVLEIYHPLSDSWSRGEPLPKAICGYGLAVFDGRIYLFGGWDGTNFLQDVLIYDPQRQAWSSGPPLPKPMAYAGAAVSERKIIVVGGFDGKSALATSYIFLPDVALSQDTLLSETPWQEGPPMPEERYGMGVASIADILYVIGGTTADVEPKFPAIAYFNQSGEWRSIDQPPVIFGSGVGVTNLGVYIYSIGGFSDNEPAQGNYRYQAMYTFAIPIIQK